jgi:hypothetical protein
MRFERQGRYEVVRWQRYLRSVICETQTPLVAHDTTRSRASYLLRKYRQPWRQLNDPAFPTVRDYVESRIVEDYHTNDFEEAASLHYDQHISRYFVKYDPAEFKRLPGKQIGS